MSVRKLNAILCAVYYCTSHLMRIRIGVTLAHTKQKHDKAKVELSLRLFYMFCAHAQI